MFSTFSICLLQLEKSILGYVSAGIKKNVAPKRKWAQKCKADSVFFLYVNIIDEVLWMCSFYTELVPCFTVQVFFFFFYRYETGRILYRFLIKNKENISGFECILSKYSVMFIFTENISLSAVQTNEEYVFVQHIILSVRLGLCPTLLAMR